MKVIVPILSLILYSMAVTVHASEQGSVSPQLKEDQASQWLTPWEQKRSEEGIRSMCRKHISKILMQLLTNHWSH